MNPLQKPADAGLLRSFLQFFKIDPEQPPRRVLGEVVRAFACLPYENLSKILAFDTAATVAEARRAPEEVLADHFRLRTGGTCFSLTATLLHLVRALGFRAEPILADRPYGADTHCAILIWLDGQPHLVDPGFLILDPIPLPTRLPHELSTSFNSLRLTPNGNDRVDLQSVEKDRTKLRLTFKIEPVDDDKFLHVWDSSFSWDMMTYPLATQVREGVQVYLRGTWLQQRFRDRAEHVQVSTKELGSQIVSTFGIASDVVSGALAIWERRGELNGRRTTR